MQNSLSASGCFWLLTDSTENPRRGWSDGGHQSTPGWETKEHQAKGPGGIFRENETLASPICEVNKTLAQERSNVPNQTRPKGDSETLPVPAECQEIGCRQLDQPLPAAALSPPPSETAATGRA